MPRLVITLLTRDVEGSAKFYRRLCGFSEVQRSDSYILLAAAGETDFALGVIDWVSELVPRAARGVAAGSYLSLVVENVDAALDVVRQFGLEIVEETRAEAGALRAVVRDLDGRIVELATPEVHLVLPPKEAVA